MSNSNQVLFIINRHSGTGYRPALEGKIVSHCERRDLECSIEFTQEPGHGIVLAKSAVEKKYKMVFAVGGDGTVNEVAQGLLHSSVPLGIIPKGSGNGLARHLQIPLSVDGALQLLDQEKKVAIDTFTINDRLSVNVSGIGFDGHIASLFGKDGKRGLFNYGRLVVQHFNRFEKFDCEMEIDGVRSHVSPFIISFANSSQFGNNAVIAPAASVCDHQLDVCLVNKMTVAQGLRFIRKLFNGSLASSNFVSLTKASEIKIAASTKVPFHIDGEGAEPTSEFFIRLNSGSLLMAVPKDTLVL